MALFERVNDFDISPPDIINPVTFFSKANPLMTLLVKFSVPSKVANTPVVGKVILVKPEVLNVNALEPATVKSPFVKIFPPKVIVFPRLLIPVPPCAPDTIPLTLSALPLNVAVITLAEKLPDAFLLTIALFVFALVAAFDNIVAVLISEAVEPPTD